VLNDEEEKAVALMALGPYLTEDLLKQAFEATLDMKQLKPKVAVLVTLTPHLTEELLKRSFNYALSIEQDFSTYISTNFLDRSVDFSLSGDLRAILLAALAPSLIEASLKQALEAIITFEGESRVGPLKALAPQLQGRLLEQALAIAMTLEHK